MKSKNETGSNIPKQDFPLPGLEEIEKERLSDAFFKERKKLLRFENDVRKTLDEINKKFEEILKLYGKTYGEAALSKFRDSLKKNLDSKTTEFKE